MRETTNRRGAQENTSRPPDIAGLIALVGYGIAKGGQRAAEVRIVVAELVQRLRRDGDNETADLIGRLVFQAEAAIEEVRLAGLPPQGLPC